MLLRAETGAVNPDLASFWTDVQTQNAERRLASFGMSGSHEGQKKTSGRRRRPRRRRPPQAGNS
jgi:hypothetical protein